jgi:hypothetical protein
MEKDIEGIKNQKERKEEKKNFHSLYELYVEFHDISIVGDKLNSDLDYLISLKKEDNEDKQTSTYISTFCQKYIEFIPNNIIFRNNIISNNNFFSKKNNNIIPEDNIIIPENNIIFPKETINSLYRFIRTIHLYIFTKKVKLLNKINIKYNLFYKTEEVFYDIKNIVNKLSKDAKKFNLSRDEQKVLQEKNMLWENGEQKLLQEEIIPRDKFISILQKLAKEKKHKTFLINLQGVRPLPKTKDRKNFSVCPYNNFGLFSSPFY